MFKRLYFLAPILCCVAMELSAQTTNGLISGLVTDPAGAVVTAAEITVTNLTTQQLRRIASDASGIYLVPQLPPGNYSVSVAKQGFATENRSNVQVQVNQSVTLDFRLTVSSTSQTIQVTGATTELNTTSATLADVIGHGAIVDLPLNGRQFTQLTLLSPGAAPQQGGQQAADQIKIGAGSISPAVNGQRPQQNNFTMDGVLNNSIFLDTWAISPPPDVLEEFNVQSHITDAQFAISSGANVNIVSRAGGNDFHGAFWEFIRNNKLNALQYPATTLTPYTQNQYGVYFGGPVMLPHFNGRDNTWFLGYWEGFRADQTLAYLGDTLTTAMTQGNFSALLGAQVGTDDLGRPEYQDEIYDPATSATDPINRSAIIRNPFPGNIIPASRINPASALILQKYYPPPNLNVAPAVLPNLRYNGRSITASDQTGIRMDHRFRNNDILFGRYNRSNESFTTPEGLPPIAPTNYVHTLSNYSQQVAAGYTHLFGSETILNLRYAWTETNDSTLDTPAGAALDSAIGLSEAFPEHGGISLGPQITLANGYSGVTQTADPFGPQESGDYHADMSKVLGNHTLGVGGMYYHIHSIDDDWDYALSFTQNATSQGALAGSTGMGPASLLLGLPDSYQMILGNSAMDQSSNWYGVYVQDQWQASKRLTFTAGLRYDYISPPNYHTKIVSGLDVFNGQFVITAPYLPLFPKAIGPSGYFHPQYNGYEPRFGVAYRASNRLIARAAFAMLDDHNNTLVQENQNSRIAWPYAVQPDVTLQNRDLPTTSINQLPAASTFFSATQPYVGSTANPYNKIPYSLQYNAGAELQLSNSMVLSVNYVGSIGREQFLTGTANVAPIPGPGSLASRGQPFPQYGGPFQFSFNGGNSSYNALQTELKESLSAGLFFQASYTWSKSLDEGSSGQTGSIQNFYNLPAEWGPSTFNFGQILVLSGVYTLPVGRGKSFMSSPPRIVQGIVGNWNVGSIVSMYSGTPFDAIAGADIANIGDGTTLERAEKIGNPYGGAGFHQSRSSWINKAAFAEPAEYTFGNERRNDLVGPPYKDVDFNVFKNFSLWKDASLQFRGEFFNIFNHTNYSTPANNVQASSFGDITGAAGYPREIQFALKLLF